MANGNAHVPFLDAVSFVREEGETPPPSPLRDCALVAVPLGVRACRG